MKYLDFGDEGNSSNKEENLKFQDDPDYKRMIKNLANLENKHIVDKSHVSARVNRLKSGRDGVHRVEVDNGEKSVRNDVNVPKKDKGTERGED